MNEPRLFSRREALQAGLIFSASLLAPRSLMAESASRSPVAGDLNLFCFGDWGCEAEKNQVAVAQSLQNYARQQKITPQALMLLGDNFYGSVPGGVQSPRWKKEFEDMYPASAFPGPCYAILGNHDYDDQKGGDQMQIAYSKTPGTRWRMPSHWYRLDLPIKKPVVTILCLDTHYSKMSKEQIAQQQLWLETQLEAPRTTPWMIVCGHHPVQSCGPHHGDSRHLKSWRDLFEKTAVDAYICGHEHDLQHLKEADRKTDWLVSGGGGKALHPVSPDDKTAFAQKAFGFLHLNANRKVLNATFVGTNANPLYSISRTRSS